MKLYPPIIEGKISAQSGAELIIPFRFNRSVSVSQVDKIALKVKTAITGKELKNYTTSAIGYDETNNSYYASFDISETSDIYTVGQYYKIQLACVNDEETGYYSSIGVFKYTSKPEVKILGFEDGTSNLYEYTGYYYNENDLSEKVASYCFEIRKRSDDSLYATSGELLHDTGTDDVNGASTDVYELEMSLQEGESYEITYTVTTVSGMIVRSPNYEIVAADTLPNPYNGTLVAENQPQSGCISIRFIGEQKYVPQGYGFVISRSDSESEYTIWRDVLKFSATKGSALPTQIQSDYSIEQGKTYKYALQLYQDSGLRSTKLITEPVLADFEDIFLSDGERQLRVRFNPKVTSIKADVLESKQDTLGGQYPFFFRNGNTNYKEFPISGLISYWIDEAEEFMSLLELGIEQKSASLEPNNMKAEREFKLKVLEWLNNGRPKLFRSPAEGNYIVRLMNVSASPNDTLGRMLHTFSCTAYEIAECNYKNLTSYGFTPEQAYSDKVLYFCTAEVGSLPWNVSFSENGGAVYACLREVPSGSTFQVKYTNSATPVTIMVGSTGIYNFNIYDNNIEWIAAVQFRGTPGGYLDYAVYEQPVVEDFSEVHAISYSTQPFDFSSASSYNASVNGMFAYYNSLKLKVGYVYVLRAQTKRVEEVYQNGDKYYSTSEYKYEVKPTSHDTLYLVKNGEGGYIDGWSGQKIRTITPDYRIKIEYNDGTSSLIDLSGPQEITYHSLNNISEVRVGNGVLVDGMYQQAEYTYGIELTTLAAEHQEYEEARTKYKAGEISEDEYRAVLQKLNDSLKSHGIKGV